jgi:DNA (cytosine-5)-methyltransferase 1
MAEAGALVQEWRVLDAQYFGVPQRRRRVFLISIFDTATATRCPDPLLPVSEGVQWHPSTSHTTRQTVTGETAASFGSGSDIANTIGASLYHKSTVVNQDVNNGHMVIEPFTKSKRPQTATDDETWVANQPNPTLNAFDQGDTRTTTVIVQDPILLTMREGKPGGGKGPLLSTDKSLSLSTSNEQLLFTPSDRHGVVQYDGYNQRLYEDDVSVTIRIGRDSSDFIAQPIEAAGFKAGQGAGAGGIGYQEGTSQTLTSQMNGIEPTVLTPTMAVRRLTPLECERLMGWPDNWTATKADGTPQSDTHRYKQCGNGVASPVAQWIGEILIATDTATATDAGATD